MKSLLVLVILNITLISLGLNDELDFFKDYKFFEARKNIQEIDLRTNKPGIILPTINLNMGEFDSFQRIKTSSMYVTAYLHLYDKPDLLVQYSSQNEISKVITLDHRIFMELNGKQIIITKDFSFNVIDFQANLEGILYTTNELNEKFGMLNYMTDRVIEGITEIETYNNNVAKIMHNGDIVYRDPKDYRIIRYNLSSRKKMELVSPNRKLDLWDITSNDEKLLCSDTENTYVINLVDGGMEILAPIKSAGGLWREDGKGFLYMNYAWWNYLFIFLGVDLRYQSLNLYYYDIEKKKEYFVRGSINYYGWQRKDNCPIGH